MPNEDVDERRTTRLVVAAMAMSGMCSGTQGRGIATMQLQLLADSSLEAADLLLKGLDESEFNELEIYQQRRLRFAEVFFAKLEGVAGNVAANAARHAWKEACKTVEPEFFPVLRK